MCRINTKTLLVTWSLNFVCPVLVDVRRVVCNKLKLVTGELCYFPSFFIVFQHHELAFQETCPHLFTSSRNVALSHRQG